MRAHEADTVFLVTLRSIWSRELVVGKAVTDVEKIIPIREEVQWAS
jgi:hypothetical protein